MKLFPQSDNLTTEKRVFNHRLSQMRISENVFDILANKWRLNHRHFSLGTEKVKIITLAAITQHN